MPAPKPPELTRDRVEGLLGELCVRLGFCLPPDDWDRLAADPPQDAGAFTDAVFRAEGLDPETADLRLWRQVRDLVASYAEP